MDLNRQELCRQLAMASGLILGYWLLAELGLRVAMIDSTVSLFWPATGLALGLLHLGGWRLAPAITIAALLANLHQQEWPVALGLAVGNTAAMLTAVCLLKRCRFSGKLAGWHETIALLQAAVFGMTISAASGATWLCGSGRIDPSEWLQTAMVWYLGDLSGILIVAPVVLGFPTRRRDWPPLRPLIIMTLLLLAAAAMIFFGFEVFGRGVIVLVFVPYLGTLYLASRLGYWPALLHVSLLMAIACYSLLYHKNSPWFALPGYSQMYVAWGYLTSLALASLFIASIDAERRLAMRQMASSEASYKALVEENPALICRFHSDGRLAFVNETFRRAFGVDHGQTAGADFFMLSGLSAHAAFMESLRKARAGEASLTADIEHSGRYFRWSARVVKESSGFGVEFHAVGLDVTEQMRAEADRRRIEQHAVQSQKLESVGLLAGGIAHEFNNLLTTVIGNLELAQGMNAAGSDAGGFLESARIAAQRAATLTGQLQDYNLRDHGGRMPLDLSALVVKNRELLTIAIPKQSSLVFDLAEGLPMVEGQESHLRQVLMSLVTNAGEALQQAGGRVVIRTRAAWYDPLCAGNWRLRGTLKAGWHALLQVEDSGSGMSQSVLARAFEPFFTTRLPGRGLGLPAALAIVTEHRGGIGVCSKTKLGTRVSVLLPALDTSRLGAPEVEAPHESSCPYCSTLSVEGDDTPAEGYVALPPAVLYGVRTGYSSHVRSHSRHIARYDFI